MAGQYGDSTRSVKAVASQNVPGQPVAPIPVLASTYHLSDDEAASYDTYGRSDNPTWRLLESAVAQRPACGTSANATTPLRWR